MSSFEFKDIEIKLGNGVILPHLVAIDYGTDVKLLVNEDSSTIGNCSGTISIRTTLGQHIMFLGDFFGEYFEEKYKNRRLEWLRRRRNRKQEQVRKKR